MSRPGDDVDPRAAADKIAPVQGYSAGIPWSLHLRAYDAYCKRYGRQQALIEGWCRGGFSTGELDMFVPGWRDEVSEIGRLRAALAVSDRALAEARGGAFEEAAKVADEWAAENLRMAMDSIHLDPALARADFSVEAQKVTDKMQAHGAHHAGAYAGCEQVAKAIRALATDPGLGTAGASTGGEGHGG